MTEMRIWICLAVAALLTAICFLFARGWLAAVAFFCASYVAGYLAKQAIDNHYIEREKQ